MIWFIENILKIDMALAFLGYRSGDTWERGMNQTPIWGRRITTLPKTSRYLINVQYLWPKLFIEVQKEHLKIGFDCCKYVDSLRMTAWEGIDVLKCSGCISKIKPNVASRTRSGHYSCCVEEQEVITRLGRVFTIPEILNTRVYELFPVVVFKGELIGTKHNYLQAAL